MNPPNAAGAALSGWPSRFAQISKSSVRVRGSPASAFSPATVPSRRVTLLPSPRDIGTSPPISQVNPNGATPARAKNASAASFAMMMGAADPAARRETVTRFDRPSAMPRQSYPGPRLEVVAGTSTVTVFMGLPGTA